MDSKALLGDLLAHAKKLGATGADAVIAGGVSLSTSIRMGQPEGLERAESTGVGLRVFCGQRIASVSSSDTGRDTLLALAEKAVAMARHSPEDPFASLAPKSLLATNIPDLDLYDPTEPDSAWMQSQARAAEESALAVKGVTNSEGSDVSYGSNHFTLATSEGFTGSYRATSFSISVAVVAGKETGMERDYDFVTTRHASDLPSATALGKSAGEKTVARLNPRSVKTAGVPVIFDPRVSYRLLYYFASAISGSTVARGVSFLKDSMAKDVFSKGITITDDPLKKRGLASRPFDGEGIATRPMNIVENGTLKTWILDLRSAKKLNLKTTGHASRGLSSPPGPGPSNFYMQPGKPTPAELMSDITSGFYVTEVFGMGVNTVTGDFSQGAAGFWIENGKIVYPVAELTIASRMQDMFPRTTAANDLEFKYAYNAPTLRIEGMTVAGQV